MAMDEKEKAEFDALKSEKEKMKLELDALKQKPNKGKKSKAKEEEPPPDDSDEDSEDDEDKGLLDKTKKSKQGDEDKKTETRRLENSIRFNMGAEDWFKTNKELLPSVIEDVLKESSKEKYDSAIDRSNAVRAAIIQSYFQVQANIDNITPSQRSAIDEFLKLTKNGREQRAESIFENIFEPTLEMMKRVKKAEEISRSNNGLRGSSNSESQYKEKLMKFSKSYHLGEK